MFKQLSYMVLIAAICVCGTDQEESEGRSFQNMLFMPQPYCTTHSNPCFNGGTCVNDGSSYKCACISRCTGDRCRYCKVDPPVIPQPVISQVPQADFGVCYPNPCKRDCRCHESCQHAGGYYCRSDSGFLGKNCTIPVPTLRCEADRIIFTVSEDFVKEYDLGLGNSYVTVTRRLGSGTSCEMTRIASGGLYEIQIPLPFTACGMEATPSNGAMIFTTQAWFNRRLTNSMFDMPIPVIEFQCRYERQYRVVTSLRPVVSTPVVITDRQFITPSISLCKVPACPATCPVTMAVNGGGVYTVGEMIYVTMSIDSGNQVTAVEEMYLSCSASPSTSGIVEIVKAGCGSTSGLPCEIAASASSHVVCVSFQTPRSLGCQEFYIHAKLQSCDRQNVVACTGFAASNRCSSSRRKRSIDLEVAPVALGPILIINGSVGVAHLKIKGMDENEQLSYVNSAFLDDVITPPQPSSGEVSSPAPSVSRPTMLAIVAIFSVLIIAAVLLSIYLCYIRSVIISEK